MSGTALLINAFAGAALIAAFVRNRAGTRKALRVALRSFLGMAPMVLAIILLIGLLLGFVPPHVIATLIGKKSGITGILLATVIGAILFVPALVAFPLIRTLRQKGAGTANLVAFITAWASIKLPQEIVELRFLGWRFTLVRLLLTIGAAAIMGFITDRILSQWESSESVP